MKEEIKTDKKYWNNVWITNKLPKSITISKSIFQSPVSYRFHQLYKKYLLQFKSPEKKLLEVGCGSSAWLPYFAQTFGFKIYGLDYTKLGCHMSEEILKRDGVQGTIFCEDMFNPPNSLLEAFDVVYSRGLVEHFTSTTQPLTACSAFLKPGGLIITVVPNLKGSIGFFMKYLAKDIYDVHIKLDPKSLAKAHKDSGFSVMDCGYLLSISYGVLNFGNNKPSMQRFLYKIIHKSLCVFSRLVWLIEFFCGELPKTRSFSPYIYCIAQKI